MAGATLEFDFTLDDREAQRRLRQLIARGESLAPMLADIGEYLDLAHRERWDNQTSPDGEPWKPLKASTVMRKQRKGRDRGILVESGDLRDLLRYQIEGNELAFGSDRIYGATQQFGDEDRGIPARAWLGFSREDVLAIEDIVKDYVGL